jgi:hypothetical protein
MAYGKDSTKLSKKDEDGIVKLLNDYFQQALEDSSWKEARDEMIQCFDYKENRQWSKAELSSLKERGQPATVNNQVKVTIDRIVGQFVQVKSKTVYKPRNAKPDTALSDAMNDIYSYIRQTSGLEYEERDVVEDGATGGFGVFEVCINDAEDDPLGQEVTVKAEDCFNIFPDPKSRRYDWNEDARFIFRAKWVDKDYLKEIYPKKSRQIEGLFSDTGTTSLSNVDNLRGESFIDYDRERVRLVEGQYKKFETTKKFVFSDGKVMDEDKVDSKLLAMADQAGITYREEDRREQHICMGVFAAGILFEHGVSERKRYSFVPYFTNRKKSGAPYSMITTAISMQDAINKRESKALALLTMNQTIGEKGFTQDVQEWQAQNARPDGVLEVEEGYFEKVRIEKNLELAQTQNLMHQQAKQDFRLITGVNPDALGEKSEVRSGVGIQRKVAMTGLVIAPIFDNFKRTREALAKTIHDAVSIAYTQEKVMTITDNPNSTRSVILSNEDLAAVKQTKYDIIISEDQDFDTIQEQQQDMLMKNLPAVLQFGPAWGRIIFEMSSIRDKDALLARVDEIMKQTEHPPEPNMSFSAQLDKLSGPEKFFVYQKLGCPPDLLAAIMQETPPPTQILDAQSSVQSEQVQQQTEQIRQQGQMESERNKHAVEQQKLQTISMQSQADQMKAGMDMEKGKLELIKKQMEIEAAKQAAKAPKPAAKAKADA